MPAMWVVAFHGEEEEARKQTEWRRLARVQGVQEAAVSLEEVPGARRPVQVGVVPARLEHRQSL